MPAFYRRYEAALAPQSEQVWVESLSLTTERRRQAVERAFEQLAEHHPCSPYKHVISRILSFLLLAPHARARGQATKGLLYIIPADPKAIRELWEITAPPTIEELRKIVGGYIGTVHGFTSIDVYGDGLAMPCVAFCNEDGKGLDLPVNWLATGMWHDALVRKGSRLGVLPEGGGYEDYLVGVIVVISGDSKLMDELFIRLP